MMAAAKTFRSMRTCGGAIRRRDVEPWKEATNLLRGKRKARRKGHIWQTSFNFPVRDWASVRVSGPARSGTLMSSVMAANFLGESCQVRVSVKN